MPPLVFGALGFATWCEPFSTWMIGNACLTGLHMIAALYSVYVIRRTAHPEVMEEEEEERVGEPESEDAGDVEKDEEDTDSNHASSEGEGEGEGTIDHADRNSDSSTSKGCFSRLVRLKTISSDRIRHLICYNGIIATYSILFLFWVFWLSDGTQQIRKREYFVEEETEGCEDFHERYVYASLVCGFSYFAFVTIAVCVSLCS